MHKNYVTKERLRSVFFFSSLLRHTGAGTVSNCGFNITHFRSLKLPHPNNSKVKADAEQEQPSVAMDD